MLIKSMIGNLNQWLIDQNDAFLHEKESMFRAPSMSFSTTTQSYFKTRNKSDLGGMAKSSKGYSLRNLAYLSPSAGTTAQSFSKTNLSNRSFNRNTV